MRHYEIVLMVHPDYSDRVSTMVQQYRSQIENDSGKIHRFEDWGRRPLAYSIKKLNKAHYVLLNVETSDKVLVDLKADFRYNEAIIRSLVLKQEEAVTEPSPMFRPTTPELAQEEA